MNILNEVTQKIALTDQEKNQLDFEKIDMVFASLGTVAAHPEIYDFDWAFHHTQYETQIIFDEEIMKLFDSHLGIEEDQEVCEELYEFKTYVRNNIQHIDNIFHNTIIQTEIFEIVVAFLVIMSIHELTDIVVHSTSIFSTTFYVIAFAFFKIFLEQRFIKPALSKRQVKMYIETVNRTYVLFAQIISFYFQLSRLDNNDIDRLEKIIQIKHLILESRKLHRRKI